MFSYILCKYNVVKYFTISFFYNFNFKIMTQQNIFKIEITFKIKAKLGNDCFFFFLEKEKTYFSIELQLFNQIVKHKIEKIYACLFYYYLTFLIDINNG